MSFWKLDTIDANDTTCSLLWQVPRRGIVSELFYVWAAMTLIENWYLLVLGGMHSRQSGSIAFLILESNLAGRKLPPGLGVRLFTLGSPLGPMGSFHRPLLRGTVRPIPLGGSSSRTDSPECNNQRWLHWALPSRPVLSPRSTALSTIDNGWMVRAGGE